MLLTIHVLTLSDQSVIKFTIVTPEPIPEECLSTLASMVLDEGALPDPDFLDHDPSNQGPPGTTVTVPELDVSMFNFSWPPNVPLGEVNLGMTDLPRGQDGGGFPFGNDLDQNDTVVPNTHPSPVSNIRSSIATTLPLNGEAISNHLSLFQAPRNEA
jgi:hypothetical protein